jgi:hypothetical protein
MNPLDKLIIIFLVLILIMLSMILAIVYQLSFPSISDLCIPYIGIEDNTGETFSGHVGGCGYEI